MTIPKYVGELLNRVRLASIDEQFEGIEDHCYGYVFRLYRENNIIWDATFQKEAERFCKWCNRSYAFSRIARYVRFTPKEHRKPYYKRDYCIIIITDPIAQFIEKRLERQQKSVVNANASIDSIVYH